MMRRALLGKQITPEAQPEVSLSHRSGSPLYHHLYDDAQAPW